MIVSLSLIQSISAFLSLATLFFLSFIASSSQTFANVDKRKKDEVVIEEKKDEAMINSDNPFHMANMNNPN